MSYPKGAMLQRAIRIKGVNIAQHLGIYIGGGEVIHFGYPAENTITKTSLKEFSSGEEVIVKQYPNDDSHRESICKTAKILLKTPRNTYNEKYNIFLNNCEDFTRKCYGDNHHLIMDQWENIRGTIGQSTTKTAGHILNGVGTAAREMGSSQVARHILGKSAGVGARGAIKGVVKAAHNTQAGKAAIETIAKNALGKNVYK